MIRQTIELIVIEWLGGAYDAEDQYPGNPDYRNAKDVNELVSRILERVAEREVERVVEREVERAVAPHLGALREIANNEPPRFGLTLQEYAQRYLERFGGV